MRVLIVSADTGAGHRSAGGALAEALAAEGCEVVFEPRAIEMTHAVNRGFCGLYNALLRHRPGWMRAYAAILARLRPNEREWLYRRFSRRAVLDLLERVRPNAVVSVHPMTNHYMARGLAELHGPAAAPPLVTVVTDPVGGLWPAWACPDAALTVVATEPAAEAVRALGAREVAVLGMPVPAAFRPAPRRPGPPRLLVTTGWAGEPLPAVREAIASFCAAVPGLEVMVVGGRERVPIGEMARLLASADAVLTKPGGLATFEAIACEVPILVNRLRPLMPQEAPTARWIVSEGMGVEVPSAAAAGPALAGLLQTRERAVEALRRHRRPDAARAIAQSIVTLSVSKLSRGPEIVAVRVTRPGASKVTVVGAASV